MNVLSLFDGISCGQLALKESNIEYENYFASELDKYAIQVTKNNFPKTQHIGNVLSVNVKELPQIDLLIGGSPCQSFSRAGDGSGFDGESRLFWEYVRILNDIKKENPNVLFLLENVVMKEEWKNIITEALGVKPIQISSSKFVPQSRERLYWTNIPNVKQPEQRDYNIRDFYEGEGFPSSCGVNRFFKRREIFNTLTATYYKGIRGSGRPAISLRESFLDEDREAHRMLTPNEVEKIQGLPKDYTQGISKTQRYKSIGNGWTVDVIAHIFKNLKK
jgi:DNA (cytosine-5)-methyltransferase 3A